MTLRDLLNDRRIRPHRASSQEIADLLRVVDRDLRDAQLKGLSTDRRFSTAYNAVLQLANIVLRASGYRTAGSGHHWAALHVLPELLPSAEPDRADYFDSCRRKRNMADYDVAEAISKAEAEELLEEAHAFRSEIITWMESEQPDLLRGGLR
jgi:uncharacterized protein (UPF0332 family)